LIPLRDNIPSRTFPFVTVLLIVANIAVFFHELRLGPALEAFVFEFGLIPARLTTQHDVVSILPVVSSMFLHGGWAHLLGNLLYLWIFGNNVEDRLGHGKFLFFYLACGIAADIAHVWVYPESMVPVVGASGAIAGVLGAYFWMYPRARVVTVVPIFILPWITELPAILFLGIWFLMQVLSGTAEMNAAASMEGAGIAWWAHVAGFVGGLLLCLMMKKKPPVQPIRTRDSL
jgi:membrane associated rhomboid family serine protease